MVNFSTTLNTRNRFGFKVPWIKFSYLLRRIKICYSRSRKKGKINECLNKSFIFPFTRLCGLLFPSQKDHSANWGMLLGANNYYIWITLQRNRTLQILIKMDLNNLYYNCQKFNHVPLSCNSYSHFHSILF